MYWTYENKTKRINVLSKLQKRKKKVFVGFAHWGNFTPEHSSPLPPLPQAALQDSQ
jgi:hypothetical protein